MDTIEGLFAEWQRLQPLNASYQAVLDRKFMLEFNYNSNHMEGNTLTYGQTEFLLLFGRVVENANMRDLEEMKASNVCLEMIKEEARDREHHLTEYFIRTLHKTMLRDDYSVSVQMPDGRSMEYTIHAGCYKTRPNSVKTKTGVIFEYASPEETPALMADLLQWYNTEEDAERLSPIELAALFHYRFIRIHPFEDGNGRISRLIVNYILARHGYPMIVIKSDDKDNYLEALNRCDIVTGPVPSVGANATSDQIIPFTDYLSQCLVNSLHICIKAAKGESIEEPDDFAKALSIIEKSTRKKSPLSAPKDLVQEKINVFNFFHRVLASKLLVELKPVHSFFNSVEIHYFMSNQRDGISSGGFFRLNADLPMARNLPAKEIKILEEAQSIMFQMYFQGVKALYNMKETHINVRADVQYELQSYVFNGQEYAYGQYPDASVVEAFINETKERVLAIISKAATQG